MINIAFSCSSRLKESSCVGTLGEVLLTSSPYITYNLKLFLYMCVYVHLCLCLFVVYFKVCCPVYLISCIFLIFCALFDILISTSIRLGQSVSILTWCCINYLITKQ